MDEIKQRKDEIRKGLKKSRGKLGDLRLRLKELDTQLVNLLNLKERFDVLEGTVSGLDKLTALGGEELFWDEICDSQEAHSHVLRLQERISIFEGQLSELKQERIVVRREIEKRRDDVYEYKRRTEELYERAQEALDEFVIEREDAGFSYRSAIMPWTIHGKDEKRYRRVLLLVLFLSLLLGYLIPQWQFPEVQEEAKIEIPERLAKLVLQKKPPPPPPKEEKEEEKPKEEKKEEEKPKEVEEKKPEPTKKEVAVVRKKAESSGVLAFKKDFAGLLDLDSSIDSKLGAEAQLSNLGATAKKSTRSIITSQSTSGSGGIQTSALSKNVGGTGEAIEGVGFSRVESSIGTDYATEDRPLSEGPGPSRTDEEIQIVFDKYKSALYRIYNRELRKDPTLQGKMVLRLTIEPDGKVSACDIDSSDMDAPSLDEKIVARVKRFNFGAKEGVPTITILFPVDFLPAN